MSIRTERITEQLKHEIAVILRDDVTDPRIGMLSILRIKLSRDLSHAQVFWSAVAVDDVDLDDMEAGLASAAPFVRRLLAERLNLRRTPAIEFRYDPSIEEGDRTLALLKQLDIAPETGDDTPDAAAPAAGTTGDSEDGPAT